MSKRKIFEAQMCTVGLESDPGVIAYMDAVFDGKAPSNQINESVSIISNQESFSKLFNRAKIVAPHTAMKISESNWDDVSKATMYASAISGMMLVEADKKKFQFKPKRGTTVERDGETYKFIGHAWVKYDPEATSKKKQWLPFSDKDLKQSLVLQAEQDSKDAKEEVERNKRAEQDAKDHVVGQQQARDYISNKDGQREEMNVAAKEPEAYTSNEEPEEVSNAIEFTPQLQELANKLTSVDDKSRSTVIKLLSKQTKWADIAASAIIDGTVNDVLKHLKSSDK